MSKTYDDPDLPATAEELAEAEALAQALEKGNTSSSPEPETAGLLRQARGAEVPDVLDRVLPAVTARRRARWWLWPAVLVPAAAGLLVMGGGLASHRFAEPSPGSESDLPPMTPWPSPSLLAAQSQAASGDPAALAALEAQMRLYRAKAFQERGPR